jgi:hypothetical protein
LRIGELKTLLALACGDDEAIREGCDWINHFEQIAAPRRLVYRCIATLLEMEDASPYQANLALLYGADTVKQAHALLNRENRFFDLGAPGMDLTGCDMHQRLLDAYRKVSARSAD